MEVITKERLIAKQELLEDKNNRPCEYLDGKQNLIDELIESCEEIDTLTVSKLRPMSEASKNGSDFLGYYKGISAEYFEIMYYSPRSGKLRSMSDEFEEDDVLGWIPMPIYKPE